MTAFSNASADEGDLLLLETVIDWTDASAAADGSLYAIRVETDDTLQGYERAAVVWEFE